MAALADVLMAEGRDARPLEEAANWADRAGDSFFQALCLAGCAVVDLRSNALSRAHVRAHRCVMIARALGEEYLASSAELIDALVLDMLDDSEPLKHYAERTGRPEDLALIGRACAWAAGGAPSQTNGPVIAPGTPCPIDALWVLNLLRYDCQGLWGTLSDAVPGSWQELMTGVRRRRMKARGGPARQAGAALEQAQAAVERLGPPSSGELLPVEHAQARVRVSVLGGFSVVCDGKPLPDGSLERRRARDLITLLAMVPGHRVRRYQALELLWPQDDYYRGPRKLYEATSEARRCLREYCDGANPIVAERTQGCIGFDQALVSCDVDDFEREARLVLSDDGDDFSVLEHARRMERLYATGPDEHVAMLGQALADREAALRMMYVDAAVAAGDAALRLGKAKLAVRYAMDAHRFADLREDVMIVLVRALKAAGRGFEINGLFKRFSRHLIEVEGVPPSVALRRTVEAAGGEDLIARPA